MAVKNFDVEGIGKIRVLKRRGARSMKIKLSQSGEISVGIPYWIPYRVAIDFARRQTDWIKAHRPDVKHFEHGQKIGRTHTLNFLPSNAESPKVSSKGLDINIMFPANLEIQDIDVQKAAVRGARNALKKQAHILENEILNHAKRHGYDFKSLSYKFMKSKWGSCNSNRHITLNYRLLDIPVHLVEYVMIHELVHLNHMNHGAAYWKELSGLLPDYKDRKKELRQIKLDW